MARFRPKRARSTARRGCSTVGYVPNFRITPNGEAIANRNDDYFLRLLVSQHLRDLPPVLRDGDARTTPLHDAGTHRKVLEVTTACRDGRLRTLIHDPYEKIAIW